MNITFDFMGNKWVFWTISGLLIVASIVGLVLNRGLHYGIEFKGGTVMDLTMKKTFTVAEARKTLAKVGQADAFIQGVQGSTDLLIRTRALSAQAQGKVLDALDKDIGVAAKNSIETVGPGWGRNVTNAAVTALSVSLLALIVYISLRFEYKMALTAILAIVHDVALTVGVYAAFALEVTPNTVAALLTILGYSLYDTIVIFHRVKENSARIGKRTFQSMANESIQQVFVRSINTTLTTLIPILALLFFGGETLRDFAFALAIGLTAASYSSIGIAAPVYAVWKETEPKFAALKRKYGGQATA